MSARGGLRRLAAIAPLRWKLTLVAAVVLTIVVVLFGVAVYADQRATLIDQTAQSLRLSAGTAIAEPAKPPKQAKGGQALSLPPGAADDDPKRLTDLAKRLTTRDTAALTTDAAGNTAGDGPALAGVTMVTAPRLDASTYQAVASSGQERHLRYQTADGPVLVELIPLSQDAASLSAAPVGVLQLSTSLASVDASLARLRTLLFGGALLGLVATVLLTIPLVRGLLRPLRRMAAASRAIAAGDLGRRVDVPAGDDELTDLAGAFNEMVGRLEATLTSHRRFVADASHELRSPLTALGGGIEMLLLGADRGDPVARTRLLRLMEGEVGRMGRLVDDLLALTRFDGRPRDALEIAPVDLVALVEEAAATTRLLAPEQTVALALDVPPRTSLVVSGDIDRLRQALLNLCANARAYTPSGGAITLGVGLCGTWAAITVADTGAGIPADVLPRVWDRFYRADPARARGAGQGGLGLGLAIVRAIVEAHGGTAAIASAPGAGTAVTLTLPAAILAAPPRRAPLPAGAAVVSA